MKREDADNYKPGSIDRFMVKLLCSLIKFGVRLSKDGLYYPEEKILEDFRLHGPNGPAHNKIREVSEDCVIIKDQPIVLEMHKKFLAGEVDSMGRKKRKKKP